MSGACPEAQGKSLAEMHGKIVLCPCNCNIYGSALIVCELVYSFEGNEYIVILMALGLVYC